MKPLRKYLTGRRGQGGGEAAKGVGLEGPITGQSTVLCSTSTLFNTRPFQDGRVPSDQYENHPHPTGNITYIINSITIFYCLNIIFNDIYLSVNYNYVRDGAGANQKFSIFQYKLES